MGIKISLAIISTTCILQSTNKNLVYKGLEPNKDNKEDDLKTYVHRQITTPSQVLRIELKDRHTITSIKKAKRQAYHHKYQEQSRKTGVPPYILKKELKDKSITISIKSSLTIVSTKYVFQFIDKNLAYQNHISNRDNNRDNLKTYIYRKTLTPL